MSDIQAVCAMPLDGELVETIGGEKHCEVRAVEGEARKMALERETTEVRKGMGGLSVYLT